MKDSFGINRDVDKVELDLSEFDEEIKDSQDKNNN